MEQVLVWVVVDSAVEQSRLFPEVDIGPQLLDGFPPGGQHIRRGRRREPGSQRVLSETSSGTRKELEQRPVAEQIEIAHVHVLRVGVTFAAGPDPRPFVVQPIETRFVVGNGGQRSLQPIGHETMPDNESHKRQSRNNDKPAVDNFIGKRSDSEYQARDKDDSPGHRQPAIQGFAPGSRLLTVVKATLVLGTGF